MHASLFLKMGGLESIIMDIAKNLDTSRFKMSILCLSSFDDKYKKVLDGLGINLFHFRRQRTFDYAYFSTFVRLLKSENVDILHAHSGCIFNSSLCAKMSSTKAFVYTEHGLPIYDSGLPMNAGIKARLEDKFAAWTAKRIFAVSDEIRAGMKERFPGSMDKVRIVTNGVDTDRYKPEKETDVQYKLRERFSIDREKILIGSVGRLVPIKNYESLIKAYARLVEKKINNIHLILIGDGVERERLEACATENGIREHVTFAGVQYDIHELLPGLDVFVLPSWTEGTSISLLEAQSCGVPAVVSNVGGNPKIISGGVNGLLFEPGNSGEMADKLETLVNDPVLRSKMGQAGRSFVEQNHSVLKMVREYEQSYLELLES